MMTLDTFNFTAGLVGLLGAILSILSALWAKELETIGKWARVLIVSTAIIGLILVIGYWPTLDSILESKDEQVFDHQEPEYAIARVFADRKEPRSKLGKRERSIIGEIQRAQCSFMLVTFEANSLDKDTLGNIVDLYETQNIDLKIVLPDLAKSSDLSWIDSELDYGGLRGKLLEKADLIQQVAAQYPKFQVRFAKRPLRFKGWMRDNCSDKIPTVHMSVEIPGKVQELSFRFKNLAAKASRNAAREFDHIWEDARPLNLKDLRKEEPSNLPRYTQLGINP